MITPENKILKCSKDMFKTESFFLGDTYVLRLRNTHSNFNNVICFLHGFPAKNQKNYDIAEHLCALGYTVYLFHYDGLGFSAGSFSFKKSLSCADVVLNFIKNNDNPQELSLLGHSWGGYILLNKYNEIENKGKLILLAPFSKFPEDKALDAFMVALKKECSDILKNMTIKEITSEIKEIQNEHSIFCNCSKINGNDVVIFQGAKDVEVNPDDTRALLNKFTSPPTYYLWDTDHLFSNKRFLLIKSIEKWLKTHDNIG